MTKVKKRILFIQTQAENAGAQEISRLLAGKLTERGHEAHQLFFYRKTAGFDGLENTSICCDKRPSNPIDIIRFYGRAIREIRAISPDIVFTFQHFGNVLGAPAARLAGVKTIIANQVSARETIPSVVRLADFILGLTPLYKKVTVNSHSLMKDYEGFPRRYKSKLVHVPHGIEDKTVDIDQAEARRLFGLPADVPLLGTAARLNPLKQIDQAINLLSARPDWHLVIAGQGPDEERLRVVAAKASVANRVIFLGELSQHKIGAFLSALDVFVFPSGAETFGLAALEACQVGIPVVANNLDVLREVLEVKGKSVADFVDTSDPQAFSAAVSQVLEDVDHAAAMISLGKKINEKYSLEAMVDAYEGMICGDDTPHPQGIYMAAE